MSLTGYWQSLVSRTVQTHQGKNFFDNRNGVLFLFRLTTYIVYNIVGYKNNKPSLKCSVHDIDGVYWSLVPQATPTFSMMHTEKVEVVWGRGYICIAATIVIILCTTVLCL